MICFCTNSGPTQLRHVTRLWHVDRTVGRAHVFFFFFLCTHIFLFYTMRLFFFCFAQPPFFVCFFLRACGAPWTRLRRVSAANAAPTQRQLLVRRLPMPHFAFMFRLRRPSNTAYPRTYLRT